MTIIKPSFVVKPFSLRDFSKGRIAKTSVNSELMPKNSVANSMNINFDSIIGSGVVRLGVTAIAGKINSTFLPLGLGVYTSSKGTAYNNLNAVITDTSGSKVYYFNTAWHSANGISTFTGQTKSRFSMLGNQQFLVNSGQEAMRSSSDGGATWGVVNCILLTTSFRYTTLTGNFTPGETVQDQTSSATAVITSDSGSGVVQAAVISASGSQVITTTPVTGFFTVDDVIKDTTSGASGKIVTIVVNFDATVTLTLSGISGTFAFADNILGGLGTIQSSTISGVFTVGHRILGLSSGVFATISQIVQPVTPSLLLRTNQMLIASGDTSQSASRIFFSSVIDPTTSPGTITWNIEPIVGDWIDVNPDDGDSITGLVDTSSQVLVFKNNGLYRLNVISKNVDAQNIFNMGAPSQESITSCQGLVYFFSGKDIRSTDGTYPIQISRLGVQDFIDAIPQANWSSVSAGNDGLNVYFSIGTVTLNSNKNQQVTYNNVVLKYSTRDQTWSTHYYLTQHSFYVTWTNTNGRNLIALDNTVQTQTVNLGTTEIGGKPIYFFLETQELDLGNRAYNYSVSDDLVVFTKNGIDTTLQVKSNNNDYKDTQFTLNNNINVGQATSIEGNYFTFKWSGQSVGTAPVFEGLYIQSINSNGLIKTQ